MVDNLGALDEGDEVMQVAMTVQKPSHAVDVASRLLASEAPEPDAPAPSEPLELHAGVQN